MTLVERLRRHRHRTDDQRRADVVEAADAIEKAERALTWWTSLHGHKPGECEYCDKFGYDLLAGKATVPMLGKQEAK